MLFGVACESAGAIGGPPYPDDASENSDASETSVDVTTDAPRDAAAPDVVRDAVTADAARDTAVTDVPRDTGGSLPPGDPQARSATEMCARWTADRVLRASRVWTAGADACDPGTLSSAAHDDAMRVLNLYRWLTGESVAAADASLAAGQQSCAVMMTVNGTLNHMPPSSWRCFTDAGRAAAGSSNLALGTSSPAASVDLYANERDQELGHRRWVFAPNLGPTWFGATSQASCMQVFRSTHATVTPVAVVAWPNPGPSPIEAFGGVWHAQSGLRDVAGATVEVRNDATNEVLAITRVSAASNYGNSAAVAWRPSGWTPAVNTTYRVTLTTPSGAPVVYRTTPVRCR